MKDKMNKIIEIIHRKHSIDVSKYNKTFLLNSLQHRIDETHCTSTEEYIYLMENNSKEAKLFIDVLHVNYSEFFRNPLTFSVLERIILPSIIMKKRNAGQKEIRIWSAACAAGQEVYSLAILMEELKNNHPKKIKYRIFATDQSESQINIARSGQFEAVDVKNVSMKRASEWFLKQGDSYVVKPVLKENIVFSVFDLFNKHLSSPPESIFGEFDLVICSNLLFYYNQENREIILDKANNCLAGDGLLVTGETEREIFMNYNYKEVYPQSAIFKKNTFEIVSKK